MEPATYPANVSNGAGGIDQVFDRVGSRHGDIKLPENIVDAVFAAFEHNGLQLRLADRASRFDQVVFTRQQARLFVVDEAVVRSFINFLRLARNWPDCAVKWLIVAPCSRLLPEKIPFGLTDCRLVPNVDLVDRAIWWLFQFVSKGREPTYRCVP